MLYSLRMSIITHENILRKFLLQTIFMIPKVIICHQKRSLFTYIHHTLSPSASVYQFGYQFISFLGNLFLFWFCFGLVTNSYTLLIFCIFHINILPNTQFFLKNQEHMLAFKMKVKLNFIIG